MTLVELLVAMLLLSLGVFALSVGNTNSRKLYQASRIETEASRLAQGMLDQFLMTRFSLLPAAYGPVTVYDGMGKPFVVRAVTTQPSPYSRNVTVYVDYTSPLSLHGRTDSLSAAYGD